MLEFKKNIMVDDVELFTEEIQEYFERNKGISLQVIDSNYDCYTYIDLCDIITELKTIARLNEYIYQLKYIIMDSYVIIVIVYTNSCDF
jgi:hypothetical protein